MEMESAITKKWLSQFVTMRGRILRILLYAKCVIHFNNKKLYGYTCLVQEVNVCSFGDATCGKFVLQTQITFVNSSHCKRVKVYQRGDKF